MVSQFGGKIKLPYPTFFILVMVAALIIFDRLSLLKMEDMLVDFLETRTDYGLVQDIPGCQGQSMKEVKPWRDLMQNCAD